MSTTKSNNKKKCLVMVSVIGRNEQRTFRHDFRSTNPEKYLEMYRKKLIRSGWISVEFSKCIER